MTEMYFEGTIIKATAHLNAAPLDSMIELRIIIDVEEEIMIEIIGIAAELNELFNMDISSIPGNDLGLEGKKCKVMRDGSGYHFLSLQK